MAEHTTGVPLPKHPLFKNLTGQRFRRWLVLGYAGRLQRRKTPVSSWHCLCDCGTRKIVAALELTTGDSKSCGCWQQEVRKTNHLKHGNSRRGQRSAEHRTWSHIWNRCTNPNDQDFCRYGSRGIKVCERWRSFETFLADMGPKPSPQHSIDRINNDGDYEPGNCRWATQEEQQNNRGSNKLIAYNGETHTLAEWARKLGLNYEALHYHLQRGKTLAETVAFLERKRMNRRNL